MAERRRDAANLSKLSPEEYLERTGVTPHLKEVMQLVLENRPAQPLEFVHEYFKNATRSSTPLTKSFRCLRYTDIGREAFMDNLLEAYTLLVSSDGSGKATAVTGSQFSQLIRTICFDFPQELLASVMQILEIRDDSVVDFAAFSRGIRASLLYEGMLQWALTGCFHVLVPQSS